jgi:hypothetical protein
MFMSWILARIWRELEYRRSLRMLSRLTDHQLEDIGLDRMQLTATDWSIDSSKWSTAIRPAAGCSPDKGSRAYKRAHRPDIGEELEPVRSYFERYAP